MPETRLGWTRVVLGRQGPNGLVLERVQRGLEAEPILLAGMAQPTSGRIPKPVFEVGIYLDAPPGMQRSLLLGLAATGVAAAACGTSPGPTVDTVHLGLQIENGTSLNGTSFGNGAIHAVDTRPLTFGERAFPTFPIWTSPPSFGQGDWSPFGGIGINGSSLNGSQPVDLSHVKIDGRSVEDLVGTELEGKTTDGESILLHVAGIAGGTGSRSDLLYYVVFAADGPDWAPLCGSHPSGEPIAALAVPGKWDHRSGISEGGSWESDGETFNFACRGSSIAKCMEAGYKPWIDPSSEPGDVAYRGEEAMDEANHLQACVRMLRGDYCGDGTAHTVNGRLIEFWDSMRLHQKNFESFTFEAAWTPHGASALDYPRVLSDGGMPDCSYGGLPRGDFAMRDPSPQELRELRSDGHILFSAYEKQLRAGASAANSMISTEGRLLEITLHGQCVHLHEGDATDGQNIDQQPCVSEDAQTFKFIPRGQFYEVRHEASGKCLDVDRNSTADRADVKLWRCHRGHNQQWEVIDLPHTDDRGDFMMRSRHSDKCIDLSRGDSSAGTNLQQFTCNEHNRNQRFRQSRKLSEAAVRVEVIRSGKCLALPVDAVAGEQLTQQSCGEVPEQAFRLVRRDAFHGLLHEASGTCLAPVDGSRKNQANVVSVPCGDSKAQAWSLRDLPETEDSEDFMLINERSNRCLDLAFGRGHDGAPLVQNGCRENENQRFRLRL